MIREIEVRRTSYWNGVGIRPTPDLTVAKQQFKSVGLKIGIPVGTYALLGHDNEIALLRPLRNVQLHWTRWFWVTDVRNLIPCREIYSNSLPISVGSQKFDRPYIHPDAPAATAKLWRYMPLKNFEKMLVQGGIFLSRADEFKDALEGTLSPANQLYRDQIYRDDPKMAQAFSRFVDELPKIKRWTYVSCWRVDEMESLRCWSEYAGMANGVAVQTTYQKIAGYTANVFCAGVRYVDRDTWIFENSSLMPFMHKNKEQFEWEKEFRIIVQQFPERDLAFDQTDNYACERENPEAGKILCVNLHTFIEQIVIAPKAPARFKKLVERLAVKHGLGGTVQDSVSRAMFSCVD